MTPVRQWTLTPLLNVRPSTDVVLTPTLRVRSVTDDDRARWKDDATVQRLTDPTEIAAVTHAVEQTADFVQPMLPNAEIPAQEIFGLFGILELLMHDAYDRIRTPFFEHGAPGLKWEPRVFEVPGSLTRANQTTSTPMGVAAEAILRGWSLLAGSGELSRRVQRALGRATRARAEYFAEDVILESTIGLECLFSPRSNQNVGNTICAASLEWCLESGTGYEPSLLCELDQRKRDYNIRSRIVHGDELSSDGLSDCAKRSLRNLRECLRFAMFEDVSGLNGDSLLSRFCARLPPDLVAERKLLGR